MAKSIRFAVLSSLFASSFAFAADPNPCGKEKPEAAKLAEDLTNLLLSKVGQTHLNSAFEFDSDAPNGGLKEVRANGWVTMNGDVDFDLQSAKPTPQKGKIFVHVGSKDMRADVKIDRTKNKNDEWEGKVSFSRKVPAQSHLGVQVSLDKVKIYDWKISGIKFTGRDITDQASNPKIEGSCELRNRLASFSPDGGNVDVQEVDGSCLYAFTYDRKCNKWNLRFRYNDIDPANDGPTLH